MCSCTRIIYNTHWVKTLYLWNTHTYIKIVRCVEKNQLSTIKCLHNILVNVNRVLCRSLSRHSWSQRHVEKVIVWGE